MVLFVKYCGGCNPVYDRAGLVSQTAALLGAQVVHSCPERADVCLLISGCARGCAKFETRASCIVVKHALAAKDLAKQILEK